MGFSLRCVVVVVLVVLVVGFVVVVVTAAAAVHVHSTELIYKQIIQRCVHCNFVKLILYVPIYLIFYS